MSTDDSDSPEKDTTSDVRESSDASPSYPIDNPPFDPSMVPVQPHAPRAGRNALGSAAAPRDIEIEEAIELDEAALTRIDGNLADVADLLRAIAETKPSRRGGRIRSSAVNPVTGQTLRAWLTIGLTVAVVTVVLTAMIMRIPPGDFAQYVSPLAGLAGLALGYWFGTEKNR